MTVFRLPRIASRFFRRREHLSRPHAWCVTRSSTHRLSPESQLSCRNSCVRADRLGRRPLRSKPPSAESTPVAGVVGPPEPSVRSVGGTRLLCWSPLAGLTIWASGNDRVETWHQKRKATIARTRNTPKASLANPAEAPAIPPKPRTPATRATISSTIASCSMRPRNRLNERRCSSCPAGKAGHVASLRRS